MFVGGDNRLEALKVRMVVNCSYHNSAVSHFCERPTNGIETSRVHFPRLTCRGDGLNSPETHFVVASYDQLQIRM